MTCKNCVHYGICLWTQVDAKHKKVCKEFKNKADFAEVVRCKDCGHKVDYCGRLMCGRNKYEFAEGVGGLVATVPEHFCSYGERK